MGGGASNAPQAMQRRAAWLQPTAKATGSMSEKDPFKHLSSGSERRFVYELARYGARPFQTARVNPDGSIPLEWNYPDGLYNPFPEEADAQSHGIEMPHFSAALSASRGRRPNAITMWLRESMLGEDEYRKIDLHARQRLQLKAQDMELALRELLGIPELEVRLGLFDDKARLATENHYTGVLAVAVPPARAHTLLTKGMRHLESGALTEEVKLAQGYYRPAFRRPPRLARSAQTQRFEEPRHPHPVVHEAQRVPLLPAPHHPWTQPQDYPISLASGLAQIARHQVAVGQIYTLDDTDTVGILHHDPAEAAREHIMPLNIHSTALNMEHTPTHAMSLWVDADYLGWIFAQDPAREGLESAQSFCTDETTHILQAVSAECTKAYGFPIFIRFCMQDDANAPAILLFFADTDDQLAALQRFQLDMGLAERTAKLLGPERRWTDRSQGPENPSSPSPGR
ncbi:MAG: hypothetical protein DI582_07910 [Azospirillum brasilense]|nr:MAG: hypothetical protein DI582_07910 [Azospirillum brasilense]